MSRLQYGFEFEMITGFTNRELRKKLREVFPEFKIQTGNDDKTHASRSAIKIVSDYSIVTNDYINKKHFEKAFNRKFRIDWLGNGYEIMGRELVFPIVSESKAKQIIIKMEKHFFKPGYCVMDKSCGLHVNTSFVSDRIQRSVNIPVLELNFDIDKWKKIFNRTRNTYCTKMITKADVNKSYRNSDGDVAKLLVNLKNNTESKKDKYRAINVEDFSEEKGGRIEFRMPGGPKAMSSKRMINFMKDVNMVMHEAIKDHSVKTTRRVNKMLAA